MNYIISVLLIFLSLNTSAQQFGCSGQATSGYGVVGQATTGIGVIGNTTAGGTGVRGTAVGSGVAVSAGGALGATALQVLGPMTIDNTAMVNNLNAEYLSGVPITKFIQANGIGVQFSLDGGKTWAPVIFKNQSQ
jgi:hypothetical protein